MFPWRSRIRLGIYVSSLAERTFHAAWDGKFDEGGDSYPKYHISRDPKALGSYRIAPSRSLVGVGALRDEIRLDLTNGDRLLWPV